MTPSEHIVLTGHVDITALTFDQLLAISMDQLMSNPDGIGDDPDFVGICNECKFPVTYTPMVSHDRSFETGNALMCAIKAEHYVNQAELLMNGYNPSEHFGWKSYYIENSIFRDPEKYCGDRAEANDA